MEGFQKDHGVTEEKRLELRLGPPVEDQYMYCGSLNTNSTENTFGFKRGILKTFEAKSGERKWATKNDETQCQKLISSKDANLALPNSSHKRIAPAQAVGWPPVRSFRKNLGCGSSTKLIPISPSDDNSKDESPRNGVFVKINMDGVPIGRKIDLGAYDSYEKLSYAIDALFTGLLAAQEEFPNVGGENNKEKTMIKSLLFKKEEYTLVYEDNEGDRILVGDVPWNMFVSTAKRLRVLRNSDLSTLHFGKQQ